jgi:hypothetical protein
VLSEKVPTARGRGNQVWQPFSSTRFPKLSTRRSFSLSGSPWWCLSTRTKPGCWLGRSRSKRVTPMKPSADVLLDSLEKLLKSHPIPAAFVSLVRELVKLRRRSASASKEGVREHGTLSRLHRSLTARRSCVRSRSRRGRTMASRPKGDQRERRQLSRLQEARGPPLADLVATAAVEMLATIVPYDRNGTTRISTRRLSALPCSVLLSATGCCSPKPTISKRSRCRPWPMR